MKSFKTFGIFLLFLFLTLSLDIYASSLSPELVEKLRKEGRLEQVVREANLAREKGVWAPNPNPPLKRSAMTTNQVDTIKAVVLLVDFSDNVGTHNPGEYDTLLFSKGFVVPTGSLRDFYWENSYQTFEVIGDAYGWFRMPQSYVAYTCTLGYKNGFGSYPYNAQKLTEDAINAADPYVNFANYDYNHDGWVDALFVVHAGEGAEATGDNCDIWSHRWTTSMTMTRDGVNMRDYAMEPERRSGSLVDMGVFSHEFGHVLGLPDLYDGDYSSNGLGDWSIMAGGSWNNNGHTPAHFDAYCKYKLGFSQTNQLAVNQTNVEILQTETSPISYRLWTSGMGGSQYFMVENRQKVGFDSYLPGEGLLIYHVDESGSNNTEWCPGDPPTPHYKVALEQADGQYQLEGCYGVLNSGDNRDPFPGYNNKRAFDDTTTPNSHNYVDGHTQVAVWNISDSDSAMYANLDVTWSRPCLFLAQFVLNDTIYGNGNGLPEPGEKIRLYFTISNIWLTLSNTTVTGSANVPGINFTDNQSNIGNIPSGGSANNSSDPMEFEISPSFTNAVVTFTLHVVGNGGAYSQDLLKDAWVGRPDILIVDDDSSSVKYNDYESYYIDALDSLRLLYSVWDKMTQGEPAFSFSNYKILIWYTGDHRTSIFSQAEVESLMSFLDHGGRLFLTSQDAAEALSGSGDPQDSIFLTDYLHCRLDNDSATQRQVKGMPQDTIGDTLYIYLAGTGSPQNQISKDVLLPDSSAIPVLNYTGSNWTPVDGVAGLRFQEAYKLVFFGFGFEGMNQTTYPYQGHYLPRSHFVMQRVMDWLEGPLPTINVTSPNGGEIWFIGDTADIVWQSISFEDNVKIEYSTDGGVVWLTIVDTTTNDGVYSWPVPQDTTILSDSCLVKVSDVDNGIPFDISDSYFSIINYVLGDANGDGVVNSADVAYLINYLFVGGPAPQPMAAGDANGDCVVNSADVAYLINYLFVGGPPPQPGCA